MLITEIIEAASLSSVKNKHVPNDRREKPANVPLMTITGFLPNPTVKFR